MENFEKFDPIAFNDALGFISGIVPQIHQNSTYILAALIDHGYVNAAQYAKAVEIVSAKRAAEEVERQKKAAEWQKKLAAEREPDQLFPKLFARRKSDYLSLQKWINETPTQQLEKLLHELTTRTQHW